MKYLNILAVAINFMAFFFLMYATASSSRPTKTRERAVEFGLYFLGLCLFSIFEVPPAQATIVEANWNDPHAYLPALRTLIGAFALVRIGVIMLAHYGQKIALQRHIAELQPEKAEVLSDV